ncbi:MAG: hypothetical protein ACOWWR_17365 [Eubacteriales bacterium]
MNCCECSGMYKKKTGLIRITDPYIGVITITGIPYYQCDKCKNLLYTEQMSLVIDSKRAKRIEERLSEYPIKEYLGAAETASLLGISRQALHKNQRINHGFIYQIRFDGRKYYLKRSVIQYKNTGDGRFPLHCYNNDPLSEYLKNPIFTSLASIYSGESRMQKQIRFNEYYTPRKEKCYVN